MNPWSILGGHHHTQRRILSGVAALAFGTSLHAQLIVSVGDWEVPEGTASTTIDLSVSNSGDPVQLLGVNLNLQIADGGPPAGGSQIGPTITGINLFTSGALFEVNNNGAGGSGSIIPQLYEVGTLTSSGTVTLGTGSHLLASVSLNTSGFTSGQQWALSLDTLNGSTVLLNSSGLPLSSTLLPGQLSITAPFVGPGPDIPEPGEAAVAAGLSLAGLCLWRTFSRARRH